MDDEKDYKALYEESLKRQEIDRKWETHKHQLTSSKNSYNHNEEQAGKQVILETWPYAETFALSCMIVVFRQKATYLTVLTHTSGRTTND